MPRSIAIATTTRAEYGILRSLCSAVADDPDLELRLIVSGTHLSEAHGFTVREIEADGVPIWCRVPILAPGDDDVAALTTIGNAVLALAPLLSADRPDLLVVLGDRSETMAFALAALLLRIPLAHLHGGEVTAGALDESIRHAMTKLATYHFVATEAYAANVRQLGEDPARVFVVGAPGLDGVADIVTLDSDELLGHLGLDPTHPFALVALHPETTQPPAAAGALAATVTAAVLATDLQIVFTGANADAGAALINAAFIDAAGREPARCVFRASLGRQLFFSALRHAAVMVGNSSAGIIEAPSFGIPVVNVGDRQTGRVMAACIVPAAATRGDVSAAIARALDPDFRERCRAVANPYAGPGVGAIGHAIKERLKSLPVGPEIIRKQFVSRKGFDA